MKSLLPSRRKPPPHVPLDAEQRFINETHLSPTLPYRTAFHSDFDFLRLFVAAKERSMRKDIHGLLLGRGHANRMANGKETKGGMRGNVIRLSKKGHIRN